MRDLFQQISGGLRLAERKRTGFRFTGAQGRFVGGGASGTRSGCDRMGAQLHVSVGPGTDSEDGACGGRAPARPGRSCGSAFSSPAARGACLAAFFCARSSRRVAVASLCERKRGNSVTRATGGRDERGAERGRGGGAAPFARSSHPRVPGCSVPARRICPDETTRIPGWLHAGRSPETVGCRPGRRGVAPRPLAANSASCTPCTSGTVQTTRRESKWKGFCAADE